MDRQLWEEAVTSQGNTCLNDYIAMTHPPSLSLSLFNIHLTQTHTHLSLSLLFLTLFFVVFLMSIRLYLTETHFFWEEEDRKDPKFDRNQVATGVTLYELKFITMGKVTDNFKKSDFKKIPKGM